MLPPLHQIILPRTDRYHYHLQNYLAYSSRMDELAGLLEKARKLALDRFRLIRPHLDENQSFKSVALAAGIPYRTARRWIAQYWQFGLAALARKKRDDHGARLAVSAKIKNERRPLVTAAKCSVRFPEGSREDRNGLS